MEQLKTCSKCKQELQIDNFCRHKIQKDGFNSICRQCSNKSFKDWYAKDIKHRWPRTLLYLKAHPDKTPLKRKRYKAKAVNKLKRSYIVNLLTRRYSLIAGNIPPELIEAKRAHLQLVRTLKEEKQKCKTK